MPFYYDLPFPELEPAVGSARITFERWLVSPHQLVTRGTVVATALVGKRRVEILANGEAVVGKLLCGPGDLVEPGDSIAVLYADGECIPYGKPYSLSRPA